MTSPFLSSSLPSLPSLLSLPPPPLLHALLRERSAIHPLRLALPNISLLLDQEIARLSNPDLANLTRQSHPRKRLKIPVPADKFPEYNFVGRLLGPRGTTLKTLEKETACKIMIRGKGSIRKDKEPDVRGKPGWEHVFNEPLHVVIEVPDPIDHHTAVRALNRAKDAVELLLVPVPEERDALKRQQLRALAIMNGTYRGAPPSSSSTSSATRRQYSSSPPSPSSGATSPQHLLSRRKSLADHFTTSTVEDDSPHSSPHLEQPSSYPYSKADTCVGYGGFIGQEFYNGAFSNAATPTTPWHNPVQNKLSTSLYALSPLASPHLTPSTVTPLDRRAY